LGARPAITAGLNSTLTLPGDVQEFCNRVNQLPPDVGVAVAVHCVEIPLRVRTWLAGKVLEPTVYVKASEAGLTPMPLTVKVTPMEGLLTAPPKTAMLALYVPAGRPVGSAVTLTGVAVVPLKVLWPPTLSHCGVDGVATRLKGMEETVLEMLIV
jgi:hypothetical protein